MSFFHSFTATEIHEFHPKGPSRIEWPIYVYPVISLNVDVSSLPNKVVHYFDMTIFSGQVQGSQLMERMKLQR